MKWRILNSSSWRVSLTLTEVAHDSDNHSEHFLPVLIIGAGPSGLALGRELAARGIRFTILEKGTVGESWARMADGLKLVSPWKCNWLSRDDERRHGSNDQLTRTQPLDYFREFAAKHELPIQSGCEVFSVRRESDQFRVATSHGNFISKIVVSATGYFSNPIYPRIDGSEKTEIPQLHYRDYKSPEQVRARMGANPLVLIVGKRLSAGQTMLELVDAGVRVALSHRTSIRFGVDDWLWPFVYRNFAHVEKLRLLLSAGRAGALDVRMPGGRMKKLIQSGTVATYPAVERFEKNAVVFTDGQRLRPGMVLYTTGFAPALKHLAELNLMFCSETGAPITRRMESVSVPNLFFLGFEMLRNFQSRFLRGIRDDAIILADRIEERLVSAPQEIVKHLCAA